MRRSKDQRDPTGRERLGRGSLARCRDSLGVALVVAFVAGTGNAQVGVEVLTLRDKPQPVLTSRGHVLAGARISGQLLALTANSVTVAAKGGKVEVPATEVLDVRFPVATGQAETSAKAPRAFVRLLDGGRFGCMAVQATARKITFSTQSVGDLSLPATAVSSVRFGTGEKAVMASWAELLGREIKRDRLVIQKGKTLDYLDGVVGEVTSRQISFLLDGDEIPVPIERVFGIIYFRKATAVGEPAMCQAALRGGDTFGLNGVEIRETTCLGTLRSGNRVKIPLDQLDRLDFAGSRIVYLSAMTPRDVEHVPYFDVTWKYRRDRNLDGGPLKVGRREFARGLALHSKTRLVYSLAGRHRRFQAWMGIDALVGRRGNVHVVISADGKRLLETDVRGTDQPQLVDLDVTGKRNLEILVDFGKDLDIADHLDLADARLIR